MRRLVPVVLLFFVAVPAASAWTWPVRGPVLQAFDFDQAHPYAAGQHRGIAIGAAAGTRVRAPVGGIISFAGTVPGSGPSLTIRTEDGLAVTLTRLGSLAVDRGAAVAEGDTVATAGGDPVHLGVREAANEQGYLDPLRFLPGSEPPGETSPAPAPSPSVVPAPVAMPAVRTAATPVPSPAAAPAPTAPAALPAPIPAAVSATPADRAPADPTSIAVPSTQAVITASDPAQADRIPDDPATAGTGFRVASRPVNGLGAGSAKSPAVRARVHSSVHQLQARAWPVAARTQPAAQVAERARHVVHDAWPTAAHPARLVSSGPDQPPIVRAHTSPAAPKPGRPLWQLIVGVLSSIGAAGAAAVALVRIPALRRGRLAT